MKKLIKNYEEWKKVTSKYKRDDRYKPHHQCIMGSSNCKPSRYPCIAIGMVDIAMTDYDRIYFTFVYEDEFKEKK